MTAIAWDADTERIFHAGVDRAVLYPPYGAGVPWNGMISLLEKPTGGVGMGYYFDGIKFVNVPSSEEFEGTIQAFTYPKEFEQFDGLGEARPGIKAGNQLRNTFGLSYRTLKGDALEGTELGYVVHLVYGCTAVPNDKVRQTLSLDPTPSKFTWDIVTKPVITPGFRPIAHISIDSTEVSDFALGLLESILYGDFDSAPRLPTPEEILGLPWAVRPIFVIATPDESLLPDDVIVGDLVFVQSDEVVYSYGGPPHGNTRLVIVIPELDLDLLPDDTYPGDIIYVESTGMLYQLGDLV